MSNYSKEVAKIRAEERAKAKEQAKIERLHALKNKYNEQLIEEKNFLESHSNVYREYFAYELSKKIRLNEAKLNDNKNKLVKASGKVLETDNPLEPLFMGASAMAGAALGVGIASIATGEPPLPTDVFCASALVGTMATTSLNMVCELTRPVSRLKRNKAQKNIEELDIENDYLNKLKEHLIETYGISVPPKKEENPLDCDACEIER